MAEAAASAFEKGDHRGENTGQAGASKAKVCQGAILALLLCFVVLPAVFAVESSTENAWRVLLEPKSMHREVAFQIPHAQRTVLAPARADGDEYIFPTRKVFEALNVDAVTIQRLGAQAAAADLTALKPRYERNRKQVIQYAELKSDRPIVASAVLAPKFLDLFENTLGEKVLLVVPNRFTAYIFPALASNYQDYSPMVFEAFRATAWPVSVEVFEVSAAGVRAVGVYQEP